MQSKYYGSKKSGEKEYLQFIWLGYIPTFVILYGVESKNMDFGAKEA